MSSVRARIEDIEAKNRSTEDGETKNDLNDVKKKRFALPNKDSKTKEQDQLPTIGTSRSKPTVLSGIEADLQDVWSVRKNIHHVNNQKHKPGPTLAAVQYSRHGAIPAQPTQGPMQVSKGTDSTEKGRIPLQEYNSESQPWSVKAGNFSYSETAKRPIESPNNDLTSPPLAKRKNVPDIIRPTNHVELPPLFKPKEAQENKKTYAKKMAQAHLRSVGMGEFTPKRDSYHPDTSSKTTKWKRRDSDEFDFET